MTGRARAASLPDGTPVGDLPLPRTTVKRLRIAGVLTLGELRGMPDRELLRLRYFGPHSLAEVRQIVAAPAESPVASDGSEVTIVGRVFRLGATYAPRLRRDHDRRPRRLLDFDPDGALPGGKVTVEMVPFGGRRVMGGTVWAAWAGEPVEETRDAP